ncbi:hypothetical protein NFI96_021626 [Prochilodus magdalenae]|nr:hypothetical protein NFI96_021626 [Prochilodus magdalenae]
MGQCWLLHCLVLQAVWWELIESEEWSVTMPLEISVLSKSCAVIPCTFTRPPSHKPSDIIWYSYSSTKYPIVYSKKPEDIIEPFRGRTEFVGDVESGNCSLRINYVLPAMNEYYLYPWVDAHVVQHKFYHTTVKLKVQVSTAETIPAVQLAVEGTPKEGETLRVSCSVVHTCPSSPPTLSFGDTTGDIQRNQTDLGQGYWRAENTISFPARVSDQGKTVGCWVGHPGWAVVPSWVEINIHYAPRSVHVSAESSMALVGGNITLECRSEANPPAYSFLWYYERDGRVDALTTQEKTVTIADLQHDQISFYCAAQNILGAANSSSPFIVTVELASEWKHKVGVSDKVASEWKHKVGVPNKVASEWKYKVGVSNKVASEWKHKVGVSNKVASEWKRKVGVSNKVANEPSILPNSSCFIRGPALRCWCKVRSLPSASMEWTVDGTNALSALSDVEVFSVRQNHTLSGQLLFNTTVQPTNVTCRAFNHHGQQEHSLIIKAPPQNMSITQEPLHVLEGQSLTLSCLSHAFPAVLSYSWYQVKENREVQLSELSERLHLQAVGRRMGPYRCAALNEIGQSRSPSTLVHVDFVPVISPNSSCTLKNGQVRCECVVESYPPAAVTWTAPAVQTNRKVSLESSSDLKSTLTGRMGGGQDHGITCHAANTRGQVSQQLTLKGPSGTSMASLAAAGCGAAALVLLTTALLYWTQRSRENVNPLVEVELKVSEQEKEDTKNSRTLWF